MADNEQDFQDLLDANPLRQYGIYNTFNSGLAIWDFTNFFTIFGYVPTNQDVTLENNNATVAAGITANNGTRNGEMNIIDIMTRSTADINLWNITFVNNYLPINDYTNDDIRSFLTSNPTRYVIRWDDLFYEITLAMTNISNGPANPRYVDAGTGYPDTFSTDGGTTAQTNQTVFNRIVEQDDMSYADVLDFIDNGGQNTVVTDFSTTREPDISLFGQVIPWNEFGTGFTGNQTALGSFTAFSRDGTVMAFGERSISNDDTSPYVVRTYSSITGNWVAMDSAINMSYMRANAFLSLVNTVNSNGLIALSDNGQRMVISNINDEKISVYDYNGSNWILNSDIPRFDNVNTLNFGERVAICGDGSHIMTTYMNNAMTEKFFQVYQLDDGGNWIQSSGFPIYPGGGYPLGYNSYGMTMSFDGRAFAVGAPEQIPAPSGGIVLVYTKATATQTNYSFIKQINDPVQLGVINPDSLFGTSMDMSSDGTRLVVGAPQARRGTLNDYGAVCIFDKDAGGPSAWSLTHTIYAEVGDQLGYVVSISSDGMKFAASARMGNIQGVTDTGYVQVFSFNINFNVWDQQGQKLGISIANSANIFIDLSGPGDRVVVGSPTYTHTQRTSMFLIMSMM
jgi:hypothetical protein